MPSSGGEACTAHRRASSFIQDGRAAKTARSHVVRMPLHVGSDLEDLLAASASASPMRGRVPASRRRPRRPRPRDEGFGSCSACAHLGARGPAQGAGHADELSSPCSTFPAPSPSTTSRWAPVVAEPNLVRVGRAHTVRPQVRWSRGPSPQQKSSRSHGHSPSTRIVEVTSPHGVRHGERAGNGAQVGLAGRWLEVRR